MQSPTPPDDKPRRKKYTRPGNVPDAGAVSVQDNGALMRAKAGERFASGETMRAIAEEIGVTLEVVEGWHRRDGWAGLRRQRTAEMEALAKAEHRAAMEKHARAFSAGQVEILQKAMEIVKDQLDENQDDVRLTETVMRSAKHAQSIGNSVFGGVGNDGRGGARPLLRIDVLAGAGITGAVEIEALDAGTE